jgi:AraC family transcriptional activator FtrA
VVPAEFSPFELGVAAEVFALPRPELGEWYEVRVCAACPGIARARGGIFTASISHGVEAIDWAETVIVPEAATLDDPADDVVVAALARAHERGARMVSYCTGAFVLAAAGILDGRTVATHWRHAARLARDYPQVTVDPNVLYIDGGKVLTSAGSGAAIDLSLHILRQDHGARVARHVARGMVIPPHRDGGQAQFVMSPVPDADTPDGVRAAIEYATEHLDDGLSIADLAARAFMSPRNFSRRFREVTGTTPKQWILFQRLIRVRELLEETEHSVEHIARVTGFGSAVTLRQRFARAFCTSPSAYRKSFRESAAERVAS